MSLPTDAVPWLEKLLKESTRVNVRLSPIKPGEVMVREIPENLRPLFNAMRHLRQNMRAR